jgi:hypothetical protein
MDTGATCNVVGYSNFCDIVGDSKPLLNDTQTAIKCYGGKLIQPMGQTVIDCIYMIYKLVFQVVQHSHPPLLSATFVSNSQQSATGIIEKYSDVFDGIGKLAEPMRFFYPFDMSFLKFLTYINISVQCTCEV